MQKERERGEYGLSIVVGGEGRGWWWNVVINVP